MILIVGGTGFIGKHLCKMLHQQGVEAVTFSRNPDTNFLAKDAPSISSLTTDEYFQSSHSIKLESVSTLICMASTTTPATNASVSQEFDENVSPTLKSIEHICKFNDRVRIIFISSGGTVYGPGHNKPIPETTKTNPTTGYAFGKLAIENYLLFLANTSKTTYTIIRPANPVGIWHRNPAQGFIGSAISNLKASKPIRLFGDGSTVRDFIDVEDLASAIVKAHHSREQSCNKIWNVGSGKGKTLIEVVNHIGKATGYEIKIDFLPSRSIDLNYSVLDCREIQKAIEWQPKIDLQTTIEKIWTSL